MCIFEILSKFRNTLDNALTNIDIADANLETLDQSGPLRCFPRNACLLKRRTHLV